MFRLPKGCPGGKGLQKVLILGGGKLGSALAETLSGTYDVTVTAREDFDAEKDSPDGIVSLYAPDILINCIVYGGIPACEENPETAFRVNTMLPLRLAELSAVKGFVLVQISSDSVFAEYSDEVCTESTLPSPCNIYGLTKFGADMGVPERTDRYFIFRPSVMFGASPKGNQFVEKMLRRVLDGAGELSLTKDMFCTPVYAQDAAEKMAELISSADFGLYHITSGAGASYCELFRELAEELKLAVEIKEVSHRDFDFGPGRKNIKAILGTEKTETVPPYKESMKRYAEQIRKGMK